MKLQLLFAALFFISICTIAQDDKIKNEKLSGGKNKMLDVMDDEDKLEENVMTLRFFNALNGEPISGATINIHEKGEFQTDAMGRCMFPAFEKDGRYSANFSCPKFITADFVFEVVASTIFFNRFSVSPQLDIKYVRVVLDWDAKPNDLDAHFVKNGNMGYHISFRNMKVLSDGSGNLDRDDLDGFGPETITIKELSYESDYEFFVNDYSNNYNSSSNMLSQSKANVKVYGEGRLLNQFEVPQGQTGNNWHVFKVQNGKVIPVNEFR